MTINRGGGGSSARGSLYFSVPPSPAARPACPWCSPRVTPQVLAWPNRLQSPPKSAPNATMPYPDGPAPTTRAAVPGSTRQT